MAGYSALCTPKCPPFFLNHLPNFSISILVSKIRRTYVYPKSLNRRSMRSWIVLILSLILLLLGIIVIVLAALWLKKFEWVFVLTLFQRSANGSNFMNLETVVWAVLLAGIGSVILAIYGIFLFLVRSRAVLLFTFFVALSALVATLMAIVYLVYFSTERSNYNLTDVLGSSMSRYQGPYHMYTSSKDNSLQKDIRVNLDSKKAGQNC